MDEIVAGELGKIRAELGKLVEAVQRTAFAVETIAKSADPNFKTRSESRRQEIQAQAATPKREG